eukprot:1157393-Pelagomonas_calceolata.AAC.7
MLVENVPPATDQPESQAVGQPLVTLVAVRRSKQGLLPLKPASCERGKGSSVVGGQWYYLPAPPLERLSKS